MIDCTAESDQIMEFSFVRKAGVYLAHNLCVSNRLSMILCSS